MTFDRVWVLGLAWLPLAWMAWDWRRSQRRPAFVLPAFVLKVLCLTAILLALAEPRLSVAETKLAVAVLADTSASLSAEDLKVASGIAGAIEKERGRHWVRVMPFARSVRPLTEDERSGLRPTPGDDGRVTDLEGAIRQAIGAMPAGHLPRVVLISDGKENAGSAARAAWQAQQLGIPIDVFPLAGRAKPALRLNSVEMPALAFSGDRFPVDLLVHAPRPGAATVEVTAEGRMLGGSTVRLEQGENQIRVQASLPVSGAIEVSGSVRSPELGEVRFARALSLRRPRVLLVSQEAASADQHLRGALRGGQFDVDVTADPAGGDLRRYQVVVFNNIDLESVPAARKTELEDFVKNGGGLLLIGGERLIYVENKPAEDPLERALPARLSPPRSPEGTCVVLIIDKSSSMEGKKMELARLAAMGVIENLRPIDLVGVLIFDNSFQWAVPIRKAEDRQLIKRLVAGITPDGGTQIAPALAESYKRILLSNATYRHVVLLTDGISEEGDSLALAKEAALQKVTISTVGLGQDVNRAYLEKVAGYAKGKSYFLVDPSGLEQILLRDVMEHTGSTAIEKPFQAVIARQAEILNGVGMEQAPPLKGFVKFTPKPGADTVLVAESKDPLLTRWQYGLGRAAVFASDAKNRWASDWLAWNGFDRFWTNVFRDLLPHTQPTEATAALDSANSEIVVEYRLARHVPEPEILPDVFVFGPGGFQRPVPVRKVAEGLYRGRVAVDGRQGMFRVRPAEESTTFPEIGFYRQQDELNEFGSNEQWLRQIAAFTGGRFRPSASQVFDSGGRWLPGSLRLWPALVAAAILLNLAELVLRKWRGILNLLRRARAAPAPAAS